MPVLYGHTGNWEKPAYYRLYSHVFILENAGMDDYFTSNICRSFLNQAATCYYQPNLSTKAEAIPLIILPKNTTSELNGIVLHYPFNAERPAGKL